MDKLLEIQGLLKPISEQDWHGKWRIQKVLDICRNKHSVCSDHGDNLRCPKCDPSSPFVAGLAKLSIKQSDNWFVPANKDGGCQMPYKKIDGHCAVCGSQGRSYQPEKNALG